MSRAWRGTDPRHTKAHDRRARCNAKDALAAVRAANHRAQAHTFVSAVAARPQGKGQGHPGRDPGVDGGFGRAAVEEVGCDERGESAVGAGGAAQGADRVQGRGHDE